MAPGTDAPNLQIPSRVEDLGVSPGLVEDLFLRRVLTDRVTTIGDAAAGIDIAHQVGVELATGLREKRYLEYLGATGRDYRIQLTELGHRTTVQRMESGRFVGGVPVALGQYQQVVRAQRGTVDLDRRTLREAFADLVLADDLLDRIGPAFAGDGAMFLYGPPGTGKTSLAERLARIHHDQVVIPRTMEVDGQLLSIFDPSLHRAAPAQPPGLDPRWVLCERPLVMVGGELDLSMLDLQTDPVSGIGSPPVQLVANNGILVVDDFGRQAVSPQAILNRWIVPLAQGIDFLRAPSGTKFTVPFEVKLVVSTNLQPRSLGDDAFLRRLRNKVYVGPIAPAEFAAILTRAAAAKGVGLEAGAVERMIGVVHRHLGQLRPYLAVDFCDLAIATCRYERMAPMLNAELIERIAELYFVHDEPEDSGPGPAPVRPANASVPSARSTMARAPRSRPELDPLDGLDALAATQTVDDRNLAVTGDDW